tara:strand:+ start:90 stop:1985 length:1896 start_codon:yes stop_codon:yes gene_type:complete
VTRYIKSGTVNTVQEINSELERIAEAQSTLVSRSGDLPNNLTAPLDMNSNRIINLPTPLTPFEPLRLFELGDIAASVANITAEDVAQAIINSGIAPEDIQTEIFTLANSQTVITTLANPREMLFFVISGNTDNTILSYPTDYTYVSTTVTLSRTYPVGAKIIAVPYVNRTTIFGSYAGDGFVNVLDYGAVDDPTGTIDQTLAFEAAALAANKLTPILVPAGFFKVTRDIVISGTWYLVSGAEITGIGGVAPTFDRDTSYLTGTVFRFFRPENFTTLRVGDPKYTVQKITKKSFSSEIEGHSDNAAGGVLATTYASARTTIDSSRTALVGIAVNDANDLTPVWASYLEAYILAGTNGNSFCLESTIFNANSTLNVVDTPNLSVVGRQGLTYNHWITTGGDSAFDETMYDSTAAIGILGKAGQYGAKYDKGIICKGGSIESDVFCATPTNLKYSWWEDKGAGDTMRSYIDGDSVTSDGRVKLGAYDSGTTSYREVILRPDSFSGADNTLSLGLVTERWTEVFSVNGAINTSDAREKQQVRTQSETETLVALECKGAIKGFKWDHAVKDKGEGARWHFGVMAQDIALIFESHGLNPDEYGLFCYDEWVATEEIEAGNRYGVRYTELIMFILGAM